MRVEIFADILLILLVSSVIFVILSLVNRNKKVSPPTPSEANEQSTENNQDD